MYRSYKYNQYQIKIAKKKNNKKKKHKHTTPSSSKESITGRDNLKGLLVNGHHTLALKQLKEEYFHHRRAWVRVWCVRSAYSA
jgi:hypothetical protein